jgi:ketosteroid isomerase-like protein
MHESAELAAAVREMYEAMATGDLQWLTSTLSPGDATTAIGTDAAEWWEGGRVVREKLAAQFEAGLSGVRYESTRMRAYEEGDVGWVADSLLAVLPDGTTAGIRITAVFHREDGVWRLVQNHASLGVPNEQAIGMSLPT